MKETNKTEHARPDRQKTSKQSRQERSGGKPYGTAQSSAKTGQEMLAPDRTENAEQSGMRTDIPRQGKGGTGNVQETERAE